jgi:hypothetical protein
MSREAELLPLFRELLEPRLAAPARAWLAAAAEEIARGAADERFGALLSAASRHARREPLAPNDDGRARAAALTDERDGFGGVELERWTLLEALRVRLVLARRDLAQPGAMQALESAFRFADEGELCALYRSLALLPDGRRFAWRAGEGCRSNMRSVFEAAACDTPYPARCFDELAFNQCALKAVFVGAPAGRILGLSRRLNPELTRMARDFADERRSAGRPVPADLALLLGPERGGRAAGERR